MNPKPKKQRKAQTVRISSKKSASKTNCMSNSVILRTISGYFSISDLTNCRLVSKLWHSEVNSVMHHSNIALKISWQCLLHEVEQLNVLIPNMSLPFNGLSFRKSRWQKDKKDSENAILQEFLQILPPITHLDFYDSSASEELIRWIIESNANHLETLSIYNTGINVPTEILGAIFQLKRLRTIHMTTYSSKSGHRGNLSAVIQKCETLERVEGIAFRRLTSVPEIRWHVIKRFKLCIRSRPFDWRPLEKYLQVVPARHRFTTLTINCWLSLHREKHMLVNLVNSCKDTLTCLRLALGTFKLQSVNDFCGECLRLTNLILDGCAQSSDDVESELLGIFPEEVILLREMKLKLNQLKKLQIVPTRPALYHLTGAGLSQFDVRNVSTRKFRWQPDFEFPLPVGLVRLTFFVSLDQAARLPRRYLLRWDSQRDGISYRRRSDASRIVKALSLERMRSLWTSD